MSRLFSHHCFPPPALFRFSFLCLIPFTACVGDAFSSSFHSFLLKTRPQSGWEVPRVSSCWSAAAATVADFKLGFQSSFWGKLHWSSIARPALPDPWKSTSMEPIWREMGLCRKAVRCRLRLDQAAALLGVGCLSREEAGQRVGRAGGKSGEAAGFHPWANTHTHTALGFSWAYHPGRA